MFQREVYICQNFPGVKQRTISLFVECFVCGVLAQIAGLNNSVFRVCNLICWIEEGRPKHT